MKRQNPEVGAKAGLWVSGPLSRSTLDVLCVREALRNEAAEPRVTDIRVSGGEVSSMGIYHVRKKGSFLKRTAALRLDVLLAFSRQLKVQNPNSGGGQG